ncbi:MAG: tetratricopeptide repeat protein, partial [bacterium]
SFGDMLSFPYAHEAMPIAREVQSEGLFGIRVPQLVPFLMLLVSSFRGLFFVSPFLLLVIPGLYSLAKRFPSNSDMRHSIGMGRQRLFWLCLSSILVYLLLISSYRAWAGGAGYGPRFLVPVIPFFIPPIAALMARGRRGYGIALGILVAYSVLLNFVATAAGASAHEHLRNPVMEFLLPSFLRGNVRPNWLTLLGCPRGASLAALAAFVGVGVALFLATGKRTAGVGGRSPSTLVDSFLLWTCALVACAMVLLFIVYRTEESAYRYEGIGHRDDISDDEGMALSFFERSLRMNPLHPYVLRDLARIYVQRGDCRKALEMNIRALAASPNDGALQGRCNAFMELCGISDKIGESPKNPELYLKRAEILERIGYQDIAERDRERAAPDIAKDGNKRPD